MTKCTVFCLTAHGYGKNTSTQFCLHKASYTPKTKPGKTAYTCSRHLPIATAIPTFTTTTSFWTPNTNILTKENRTETACIKSYPICMYGKPGQAFSYFRQKKRHRQIHNGNYADTADKSGPSP